MAFSFVGTGCRPAHTENLTQFNQQSEPSEIRELVARSKKLHDISGSGTLQLTRSDGQSVVFDLIVAMQPPDQARFRAKKFGSAVLDLTVIPDGIWLETSQHGDRKAQMVDLGNSAAQINSGLAMLNGGYFDDPDLTGVDTADQLILTQHRLGQPALQCWVNRKTLAPRKFQMTDDTGAIRFTLELSDYLESDGAIWPRKITAISPAGTVVVSLDDVTLNGGLTNAAFIPPVSAEKLR